MWSTLRLRHRAAAILLRSLRIRLRSSSSGLRLRSLTGFLPPMLRRVCSVVRTPFFGVTGGVSISRSRFDWEEEEELHKDWFFE